MSEDNDSPIRAMTEEECWARLTSTEVGRIALSIGDEVEIFPVNYVADGKNIFVRTAEGTKLFGVVLNVVVAFEIDGWDEIGGWSVIVKAHGVVVERVAEREYAEGLHIHPFIPLRRPAYLRLEPRSISGRAFRFGPPVEDYWL